MRIALFAGTTEGRILAERLAALPVEVTVFVATDYGAETLEGLPGRFRVVAGRLDREGMRRLFLGEGIDLIIDATHPYAVAASSNIAGAANGTGVERVRLLRPESPRRRCEYVDSVSRATERLRDVPGRVLVTTGAKELDAYTTIPDFARRLYPRVLPTAEAVGRCAELGFRRGNIIAMQGPFSLALNQALLEQYAIETLVTKDGGTEGGFPEKMLAAESLGVRAIVVGRPPDAEGCGMEEMLGIVRRRLEATA